MPARSLFIVFFFSLFILPETAIFAQQKEDSLHNQKEDTITVHTYQKDSSEIKQEDTAVIKKDSIIISENKITETSIPKKISRDSSIEKRFNPRKATLRSAILPGWGQFYNKKYWKIPIIYGALGITAGVFFYNLKTYKQLRNAVIYRYAGTAADSARVPPDLQFLDTESLIQNRNIFRQNIDYSVLVFLGFWVLNIIDADVDANLKAFNVSPDISMKLHPAFNNTTGSPGISLVFFFKEKSNQPRMPLP
ncbi:MAG TPA: DUF5683 domain-containing protein [Hanamia sp.]|nr:DUF5683 domain-containing protein [Hanamia sp.]